LDAEINSVLSAADLITPDQVQGQSATLRDAVLAGNWPKLRDARGKILIALDDNAKKVAIYRGTRRSLEGRAMFINTDESSPAAAYLTLNEPLSDAKRIRAAVEAGFLVRTRADADTAEARSGETARREAALTSGAQYVSTDYMQPDRRFGSYTVRLPDGATTICNPVRQAQRCGSQAVGR
ncbi:MAG: Ca2+-dependent phosphoinositide-specific phospholipase C, partial [Steroidobacteraceae bacterium]